MRRSPLTACITVILSAGALGGACGGSSSGGGLGDAGPTTDAGPTDAGVTDARSEAACVTIDPAAYDKSCGGDSDCIIVPAGTLCTGGCGCGGVPINTSGSARYQAATASVKLLACPCASPGRLRCVQNTCTLCVFGPSNPPGCPDGG